jgi:hypothetical protein
VLKETTPEVARREGHIELTSACGLCEPFDVVEPRTTDRLREKLGV